MLAERTRLELATPGVTGRYSNQLNYRSNSFVLFALQIKLFFHFTLSPVKFVFILLLSKIKINLAPGNDLLSHRETPHYHRRYCVSLLSSEWDQVVPQLYCLQTNSVCLTGADTQNRTGDLILTKDALYRLSHISKFCSRKATILCL